MGNDVTRGLEPQDDAGVEGQNTEELPEVVVLDEAPAGEGTKTEAVEITPTQAGTTDEVYVILPENDTSDIPVVETQVLDDPELDAEAAETGDLAASETAALADHRTEAITDPATEVFDDGIESRETQNLDSLTNELNDQVLAESAGVTSEILPAADLHVAPPAFVGDEVEDKIVTAPTGRGWVWGVAGVAALLAVAAGASWYLGTWDAILGEITGAQAVVQSTPGSTTTETPAPGGQETPVVVTTAAGHVPSEQELNASKDQFRGKLIAALELGFGGEAKNE